MVSLTSSYFHQSLSLSWQKFMLVRITISLLTSFLKQIYVCRNVGRSQNMAQRHGHFTPEQFLGSGFRLRFLFLRLDCPDGAKIFSKSFDLKLQCNFMHTLYLLLRRKYPLNLFIADYNFILQLYLLAIEDIRMNLFISTYNVCKFIHQLYLLARSTSSSELESAIQYFESS